MTNGAAPAPSPGGAMTETAIYAAGGVVWRIVDGKLIVLLIHRTRYRDVTLPKGKVDPGETLAETAVREILEETGIRVSLGVPVGRLAYRLPSKRQKIVHYWAAEATDAAIRPSDVRAEPRDRGARVGDAQEGARAPELPGRRRDPRELPEARRRGRPRAPSRSSSLRHAKALGARRVGRHGRGAAARAAGRKQAKPHRRAAARLRRRASIISSPPSRCVKTVTPLVGGARAHDRSDAADQPGRLGGGRVGRAHASSASACAPARPPCSAATARCCPRS